MNEEQLQEVFEQHGGDLTDEQMGTLLDGGEIEPVEGDTTDGADGPSSEPEAGEEATSPTDKAPEGDPGESGDSTAAKTDGDEQQQVIMAKDGEHTIPYEKLVEARDSAKNWKQIAEQKDQVIESLQAKEDDQAPGQGDNETPPDPEQSKPFDFPAKRREMMQAWDDGDDALYDKLDIEIQEATDQKIADQAAQISADTLAQRDANAENGEAETAATKILEVHPELNEDGTEFYLFERHRDKFIAEGKPITEALKLAEEAVFPTDKKATAGDTAVDGDKEKIAAKVKDAEGEAQAPGSLSDVPGGHAHHDEGEAMRDMTASNLMDKFEGKSQEQIESLLAKAL